MRPVQFAALCRDVIKQIAQDMESGAVPRGCRSFADLHDYCDANEYLSDLLDKGISLVDLHQIANVADAWLRARPPEADE